MLRLRKLNFSCRSFYVAVFFAAALTLSCRPGGAAYLANGKDAGDDLFTHRVVPRIEIQIPPDSMKVLRDYHQVWRQPRPERIDVKVTVREGNQTYTNVAVHLKGSFSYQDIDDKPSLTLKFDKFAPGQRFHGLQKIHLNNSVQDPTYLCETLARELFNETGVPAPRAGHAFVRINGRNAGFYVLLEGSNKQFVRRHFESAKGNLYDGGSGGDVTKALQVDSGESPNDRSDLTNLVKAARERISDNRLEKLQRVLDVERFRTFAALEVFLVHWDGYCAGAPNNYRVFHDTTRDKMVFMPHGMDQLFGVSSSTEFSITPAFKGLVANGLFSIPEERQRYRDRIAALLTNECSARSLHARVDRIVEQLRPALAREPDLRAQLDSTVRGLKSRITARVASVERQLNERERFLAFNADGTAHLTGWQFKGTLDRPALGSRTSENGKQLLQVRARGNMPSSGAWRRTVLLEKGHYELSAVARAEGINHSATNTGVILRVSGERSTKGLSTNASWTPLRYEFDVHGIANAELICEFRGAQGSGYFETSTLKLTRKGPPRAVKLEDEK
ncbi:MAG TPA: CotH kinase family protein [Methylomirabilota bacterium]|nr:CotH kinase family protein [Methylomirabilota bacterium]